MKRPLHKKIMPAKVVLLVFGCLLLSWTVSAQIQFSKGKELRLVSSEDDLYFPSGIEFSFRHGKITDYSWKLLKDSIAAGWTLDACMNGDCKLGIPAEGDFINLSQTQPDTMGFIRFHVFHNGIAGTSVVKLLVKERIAPYDADTLTFHITYVLPLGITDIIQAGGLKTWPVPFSGEGLYISAGQNDTKSICLLDAQGRKVYCCAGLHPYEAGRIPSSGLKNGLYFLQWTEGGGLHSRMLIKQ